MRSTEPPPLAQWILEHATAGETDEALAGDLREGYSAGLSNGWYWRQVLAACVVSWTESFRARIPLLIFALLWSMMAPASKVFVDRIEDAAVFDRILAHFGGAWVFPALAGWLVLNSIFLWCGISVFVLSHSQFWARSCGKVLRRAFMVASLASCHSMRARSFGSPYIGIRSLPMQSFQQRSWARLWTCRCLRTYCVFHI